MLSSGTAIWHSTLKEVEGRPLIGSISHRRQAIQSLCKVIEKRPTGRPHCILVVIRISRNAVLVESPTPGFSQSQRPTVPVHWRMLTPTKQLLHSVTDQLPGVRVALTPKATGSRLPLRPALAPDYLVQSTVSVVRFGAGSVQSRCNLARKQQWQQWYLVNYKKVLRCAFDVWWFHDVS